MKLTEKQLRRLTKNILSELFTGYDPLSLKSILGGEYTPAGSGGSGVSDYGDYGDYGGDGGLGEADKADLDEADLDEADLDEGGLEGCKNQPCGEEGLASDLGW